MPSVVHVLLDLATATCISRPASPPLPPSLSCFRHKSELVQSWATSDASDAEDATTPSKLCSFAQMVLEELPQTVDQHEQPLADFTYSPVLTWRPGRHKYNRTAERREWLGSEEGPLKKSSKRDGRPVELKTLNLSDTISLKAPSEKELAEVCMCVLFIQGIAFNAQVCIGV